MLEQEVISLFGSHRVESYSHDEDRGTIKFTLEVGDFSMSDLLELQAIVGTDDIHFHVCCQEQGSLAGDVWTESRMDVFVNLD